MILWSADVSCDGLTCLMVHYLLVLRAKGISGSCVSHHPAGLTGLVHIGIIPGWSQNFLRAAGESKP